MQIQVNTDNHIEGRESLEEVVHGVVEGALARFGERITRVEVHLRDENAHKPGDEDKKCTMEARLTGLQPIAVSHHAATIHHALDGAADKLEKAIDSTLGRIGR